jgi:hypothetical protein
MMQGYHGLACRSTFRVNTKGLEVECAARLESVTRFQKAVREKDAKIQKLKNPIAHLLRDEKSNSKVAE